jgi:hypothetical protein
MSSLPWDVDLRRKAAVDIDRLGAEELRLELIDLRDIAEGMSAALRRIIHRQAENASD